MSASLNPCPRCRAPTWVFGYHLSLNSPPGQLLLPLLVQKVKNLPVMLEIWVPSLGCEEFLEKEMATHSSILAWRIP